MIIKSAKQTKTDRKNTAFLLGKHNLQVETLFQLHGIIWDYLNFFFIIFRLNSNLLVLLLLITGCF